MVVLLFIFVLVEYKIERNLIKKYTTINNQLKHERTNI